MASVFIKQSGTQISVGSHALYVVNGDDDTIVVADNSNLSARGAGLSITAQGAGDVVTIGDMPGAIGGATNVVTFLAPGVLHERANSRVIAQADYSKLSMAGDDSLNLSGRGDIVYAVGANNQVTVGQNGFDAVAADLDLVLGLNGGSLLVLDDSSVRALGGGDFTATIGSHDRLFVTGTGAQIYATGADDVVTIAAPSQADGDVVHMDDGVVIVAQHSSATIFGDNLRVGAAGFDTIAVIGDNDRVTLGCFGNNVVIGQNGGGAGGVDVLQFAYSPLVEPITVLQQSNVRILGSNADVALGGDDQVTLVGYHERIVDQTGDNHITIGGNGSPFYGPASNFVSLAQGDTVTMLANSNLDLVAPDSTTNGQYAVHMAANDALFIDGAMTVYVPKAAGHDVLVNFDSNDVLRLAAHFSSADDLLAHTVQESSQCSTIQLDAGLDTLTLSMDKATLATYAQQGLIKFA